MGLQLLVAVGAQTLLLLANLLFAVNFFQTVGKSCCASAPVDAALFREPSAMEAPAS